MDWKKSVHQAEVWEPCAQHESAYQPGVLTSRPSTPSVTARVAMRSVSGAPRRRTAVLTAVILTLALAAAGCGSMSSSSSAGGNAGASSGGAQSSGATTSQISHAKTKFVFHAGLAFGAFHRWIYKPAKAGDFSHPFLHKLTLIKAALAGLFVYHELKLALKDAQADPTLSKLVAPITALQTRTAELASSIKSGQASPAGISAANGSIGSIGQLASQAGQPVADLLPSHP